MEEYGAIYIRKTLLKIKVCFFFLNQRPINVKELQRSTVSEDTCHMSVFLHNMVIYNYN